MKPAFGLALLWLVALSSCSTLGTPSLTDEFSLRVAVGTVSLRVESRTPGRVPVPQGLLDQKDPAGAQKHRGTDDLPLEDVTLEKDVMLSAGQSYHYSLVEGERFAAFVQRAGVGEAVVEVTVRGTKATYTLAEADLLGRSFSLARSRL